MAREPLTPRAPTADELVAQLEQIRLTGWSMSFGEREEGLAAAAVPIRNQAGVVHAALSISGPTARLTAERLEGLRDDLSAAAVGISRAQGWIDVEATPRSGIGSPRPSAPLQQGADLRGAVDQRRTHLLEAIGSQARGGRRDA